MRHSVGDSKRPCPRKVDGFGDVLVLSGIGSVRGRSMIAGT